MHWIMEIRFIAIQKSNALWEGIWGGFYAVSTTRARNAYTFLCGFNSALSWHFPIRDKPYGMVTVYMDVWLRIQLAMATQVGLRRPVRTNSNNSTKNDNGNALNNGNKVYRDSEKQCIVGRNMGRFLSSFNNSRTQRLYLYVWVQQRPLLTFSYSR